MIKNVYSSHKRMMFNESFNQKYKVAYSGGGK